MTFQEWKRTDEGEDSYNGASERADGNQGIYIDDLMWSDYKASDDWEPNRVICRSATPRVEDLGLSLNLMVKYLADTAENIEDLQLKDAKENINRLAKLADDMKDIAKLLHTKHNIKQN